MEGVAVTNRESLLQRVREAVASGNHAGDAVPHPARDNVGYQGAGPDLVRRFCDELTAAGGVADIVAGPASAASTTMKLVQARQARRVLLGQGSFLDTLGLADQLRSMG